VRIAAVNRYNTRLGGAETYLEAVLLGLAAAGHQIALVSEVDGSVEAPRIRLPDAAPAWSMQTVGTEQTLTRLAAWRPDVIYLHGIDDLSTFARILDIAPTVLFEHGYDGTCISGSKMFAFHHPRPCARRFGWQCLLRYYPHRCGGLNPVRMWTEYQWNVTRLALMRRCTVLLVASDHMHDELLNHGLQPERVHTVALPVGPSLSGSSPAADSRQSASGEHSGLRLLFIGRMTRLKGGPVMLDAVALAAEALKRDLRVTFVGDGPERSRWEKKASLEPIANSRLKVEFTGWLDSSGLGRVMHDADLLVVPSLWPEPFGLVGLEAGLHGLPAAAFAVGGIKEWLKEGVNGSLAPANPPTVSGLARAIVECLCDPVEHGRLREGALNVAAQFSLQRHLRRLLPLLERAKAGEPKQEVIATINLDNSTKANVAAKAVGDPDLANVASGI
jgi:glycosyltransferase involved in cell wall biosynthesis